MNYRLLSFRRPVQANVAVALISTCLHVNVMADVSGEYNGGPNPEALPSIECVAGDYETENTVTVSSNGRYKKYGVSGSHRFDASNVVFDGIESDGDTLQHWPIAIKVDEDSENQVIVVDNRGPAETVFKPLSDYDGTLQSSSSRSSRDKYSIYIPEDVVSVRFRFEFDKADSGEMIYMKLTDPGGNGTFYNHATNPYEYASIDTPKEGIWKIRVAMKANTGYDINYTLKIDEASNSTEPLPFAGTTGCWYGGIVYGAWDENGYGVERLSDSEKVEWEDPYHHSGGITLEMDNFLFENITILSHGDGIRSNGNNNIIDGAYVADIHDDCVENDRLGNLTVKDSFFDGCYVGFSARPSKGSGYDGSDNLFELRDSLVRLEPQPTVYKPEKYGAGPGHGQFFKWSKDSERAMKLAVHNTIFLATEENRHGGGLGVEDVSDLESCSNNVMVWAGSGSFPNADALPSCFRLTTDISEWAAAEAAWRSRYPDRPAHP